MKCRNLLAQKGNAIHRTTPSSMLDQVVRELVDKRIGSLLVMEGDLVKSQAKELSVENHYLKRYLQS